MKINKRLDAMINIYAKESFLKSGKLDEAKVLASVALLKKLPGFLPLLSLKVYLRRLRQIINSYTLEVETVQPLEASQLKSVRDLMSKGHLIAEENSTINPALMGGLRIKIGDLLYDNSIAGKINQLKEAIYG